MKSKLIVLFAFVFSFNIFGLQGLHFLIGDKSEEAFMLARYITDQRNDSEHAFEPFRDSRPAQEQVLSINEAVSNLNYLVENGPVNFIVDISNQSRLINEAGKAGLRATLVDNGYNKLEIPSALGNAEQKYAPSGTIVVIKVQKPVDLSGVKKSESLIIDESITFSKDNEEIFRIFTAKNQGGSLVGMARVEPAEDINSYYLEVIEIAQPMQGKGYGREFFERIVTTFTDNNFKVRLQDVTDDETGQKLYGGEDTLKKFNINVKFGGVRQVYILSKTSSKNNFGVKSYYDAPLIARFGANNFFKAISAANSNAGSIIELIGYLKSFPSYLSALAKDAQFLAFINESMQKAAQKANRDFYDPTPYINFYNELSNLRELISLFET